MGPFRARVRRWAGLALLVLATFVAGVGLTMLLTGAVYLGRRYFRPDTVTPLELLWSLAALVGLGFTLWMLRDARGDRRYLRAARLNGSRMIVANGAIRWETIRATTMALFLAVGVGAMTRVNPPQVLTPGAVLYSALALVVPLASVYGSFRDRRDRALLLESHGHEERARAAGGC